MNVQTKVLTFLYHEVVDPPQLSGFQGKSALPYKHGVKEFEENFKVIVKHSNNIITIKELNKIHKTPVTLLTFDDGGKSALYIADILDKYNLKGHFFITTAMIGNKYFLNKNGIYDLRKRGHIIGSHSHTHPNFFKIIPYSKMIEEWMTSKTILEDIIQEKVISCSIPCGADNHNSYISAKECGYKYIFNSKPTLNISRLNDLYIIGRICPKAGTEYRKIEDICNYRGIRKLQIISELKEMVKNITFPLYSKLSKMALGFYIGSEIDILTLMLVS